MIPEHTPCIQSHLPVEVQLSIIDFLDAMDIIHLQQTSQYFLKLIEVHAETIWKSCLDRLCAEYGLFVPTFAGLSTASDFKRECTREPKLRLKYAKAIREGLDLEPSALYCPISRFGGMRFDDMRFIPGGRYAITSESTGRLSLWDFGLGGVRDGAPKHDPLVVHQLPGLNGLLSVNVHSTTALQILTAHCVEISTVGNAGNNTSVRTHNIQVSEMALAQNGWSASNVASLLVKEYVTSKHDAFLGTKGLVVSVFGNGTTMIWDYVNDRYCRWNYSFHGDAEDDFKVLKFDEKFTLYHDLNGLHVFENPPFEPVGSARCFDASQDEIPVINPVASFTIAIPGDKYDVLTQIPSSPCRSLGNPQHPFNYELLSVDSSTREFTSNRYRFSFNGLNPESSTLTLVQALQGDMPADTGPARPTPQVYHGRGGHLWTVWEDYVSTHPAAFLSHAKAVDHLRAPADASERSEGHAKPLRFLRQYMDSTAMLTCRFTPDTGKVAVVYVFRGVVGLEVYELLD